MSEKNYPYIRVSSQEERVKNGWRQNTTAILVLGEGNEVEIPQETIMRVEFDHDAQKGYPTLLLRLKSDDVELETPAYLTSLQTAGARLEDSE